MSKADVRYRAPTVTAAAAAAAAAAVTVAVFCSSQHPLPPPHALFVVIHICMHVMFVSLPPSLLNPLERWLLPSLHGCSECSYRSGDGAGGAWGRCEPSQCKSSSQHTTILLMLLLFSFSPSLHPPLLPFLLPSLFSPHPIVCHSCMVSLPSPSLLDPTEKWQDRFPQCC